MFWLAKCRLDSRCAYTQASILHACTTHPIFLSLSFSLSLCLYGGLCLLCSLVFFRYDCMRLVLLLSRVCALSLHRSLFLPPFPRLSLSLSLSPSIRPALPSSLPPSFTLSPPSLHPLPSHPPFSSFSFLFCLCLSVSLSLFLSFSFLIVFCLPPFLPHTPTWHCLWNQVQMQERKGKCQMMT